MSERAGIVFVAACFALTLTGCGEPEATKSASKTRLVVGYDREPDTLNRFSTHILEDTMICISEGLTVWNENMETIPILAETVPSPENGLAIQNDDGSMDVTWKLRQDVRWHDGQPFTSRDVAFTVAAINDPGYNPESTDGFDQIDAVSTPDTHTAVVHYRSVYAPYQDQFWRGTLPAHLLEKRDLNAFPEYDRSPIGTGPYRVSEWKTGESLLLTRNEDYWRGVPAIEQIEFRFLPNSNTRVNQLRTGEVQLVDNVPVDKLAEAERSPGTRFIKTKANSYVHIALNLREVPAFRDVRVRQAIALAVDRLAIANQVLEGLVDTVDSVIQPMSWAHNPSVRLPGYDPDQARALLMDAGWQDHDGDGWLDRNGEALAFSGTTRSGHAEWEKVLQVIQAQLKDVGIRLEIQNYEPTLLGELWFTGKIPFFLSAWTLPADPEITLFFASDRTPPRGRNIYFYENEPLTRLLYASGATIDRAERRRLLFEAQEIVARELPVIPLYNRTVIHAIPDQLEGPVGNPTNAGLFWNVHEWRFKDDHPANEENKAAKDLDGAPDSKP